MAAEAVAEEGQHLHGGGVVLAGREAGEQRRRQHVGRHAQTDRLLHRPPALARVLNVGPDPLQVGVVGQAGGQQFEQPAADDAPVAPHADDGGGVDVKLAGAQQLEALGVGLHHPVLDAVVDHLGEVAGAHRPAVHEPSLGGEGVEDRLHDGHLLRLAADHEAEALLQAPDAAAHAGVDEEDPPLGQQLAPADGVVEVGVAPSMTKSPGARRPESSTTVASVGGPDGTITHTARGAGRAATRSAIERRVPVLGGEVEPHHLMPPPRSRCVIPHPIRPNPTMPSLIKRLPVSDRHEAMPEGERC